MSDTPNPFTYAPAPQAADVVDIRSSYGLFIDGEWADPVEGGFRKTVNPATEQVLAEVADAWAPYLTMTEGIRIVAKAFTTDVSKLSCCA